jgi:thiamine-phosphate pyrophosphorylase
MLITDGSLGCEQTLLHKLELASKAGIDAIQLREKGVSTKDLFLCAKRLRALTSKLGVSLFINERLDLALAVNADGVHLPEDAPFVKTPLQVGRSVHSLEAALRAEKEGVSYLLFGPIFSPLSKVSSTPTQGLDKLREVAQSVQIPVIAVGGITLDKIPMVIKSGAAGVAAISSLLHAQDIPRSVAAFKSPFLQKKQRIQGLYALLSSLPIARLAIEGGVDVIQFRHKGPYRQSEMDTAREIRLVCRKANIPFLVNDRSDIALALDADGVHLGQTDLPIPVARKILGPNKIIGGTSSTVEQALNVEAAGADYVGFGHIFATGSKQKDYPPIGLKPIGQAKEKLTIPLIAIGGICEENAASVLAEGADGIAMIAAISQANDPCATTQRIKRFFYDRDICKANLFAGNRT